MFYFLGLLEAITPAKIASEPPFSNSTCVLLMVMYHINFKIHLFKLKLLRESQIFSVFQGHNSSKLMHNLPFRIKQLHENIIKGWFKQ